MGAFFVNKGLLVEIKEEDKLFLDQQKSSPNIGQEYFIQEHLISINTDKTSTYYFDFKNKSKQKSVRETPWDEAYSYHNELLNQGVSAFVEPLFDGVIGLDEEKEDGQVQAGGFLKNWPSPPDSYPNQFTWHLDDGFSQLASVRDKMILNKPDAKINIAHIDTGYVPTHTALPVNLHPGKSFIKGEEGKPAIDVNSIANSSFLEQDFHGTATMTLLAGKEVGNEIAYGRGSKKIGAIPFADIYPYRVSEQVALACFLGNTVSFVKAIEDAITQKCEVISISMGGLPTRAISRVINKAYKAGVTVVVSAGNNWMKGIGRLAPKHVLYPARFDRVITVTGACFNHEPYNFKANNYSDTYVEVPSDALNREPMQGNYGPKSAMKTAIAAYSPNIAYCDFENQDETKPYFRKTGAGTSVAVPQVSAAAALWLIENRENLKEKGYAGTWKQVEAVKHALFNGADKTTYDKYKEYYGNGLLRVKDTFEKVPFPEKKELKKAKRARVSLFAVVEFFNIMFIRGREKKSFNSKVKSDTNSLLVEMLSQEFIQILEVDPDLMEEFYEVDLESDSLDTKQLSRLVSKVAKSPYSSIYFKNFYKTNN